MRIGLLGPYGLGNLGDAAIQDAVVSGIRRHHPGTELVGISLSPNDTRSRHGIEAFPIGRMAVGGWPGSTSGLRGHLNRLRRHPSRPVRLTARFLAGPLDELAGARRAMELMGDLDLLLMSGGGQLDDYWGGPWTHPYSLALWTTLARLRGVPVGFVSLGAGPLDSRMSRLLTWYSLRLAAYRSYRDLPSKRFVARSARFRRDDPVVPDLAFSLPVTDSEPDPSGTVVALGVMSYGDPRVWPEPDPERYGAYVGRMAELATGLAGRGYRVVLFPGEAVYDRPTIDDVLAAIAARGPSSAPGSVIAPTITSVADVLDLIGTASVVVASRFHSVLLSHLLLRPVVALSYHGKVATLMRDAGQGAYSLAIDTATAAAVLERVDDALDRRVEVKAELRAFRAVCRQLIERQYRAILGLPGPRDGVAARSRGLQEGHP